MTARPRRPCRTPRCAAIVDAGYCPRCRLTREQARGSRTVRGYDNDWLRLSAAFLKLHRWCGERADFRRSAEHSLCTRLGLDTRATQTDHVVSVRLGGARLDVANLQALCAACNARKAATLEQNRSWLHTSR